jgi:hypothetical protein
LKCIILLSRSSEVDLVQTAQDKPHFSLVLQTLTVREIGNGKVVKPKYGDDDVFRTMALCHRFINDPEIQQALVRGGMGMSGKTTSTRSVGMVRTASQGYGNPRGGFLAYNSQTRITQQQPQRRR